jgi:hypothetical protein
MISLVFPMFDEEQNIGPLLASALALAPRLADDFEIEPPRRGDGMGCVDTGRQDQPPQVDDADRLQQPHGAGKEEDPQ